MEYLYLLAGLVLILAGANYLTDGSVALAERFRVPGFLIGLTIVAVGTSTPELVVSFLSALEGEGDMAVGNVVGSNLFNVFIILGVCALIRPLPLTRQNIRRDLPVGVAASLVLYAVLADEVLDSGVTLQCVAEYFRRRGAASVRTVVMVEKELPRPNGLAHADWTGFTAPDRYLVGYGLDADEHYRNLPYIAALN